jgi:hypothetical protein
VRLSRVREGDIVRVDDGFLYFALVRGRRSRRLLVDPISGPWNPAPVKATEVIGHWRRVGPRRESADA